MFRVRASYHGEGEYTLAVVSEEGEDSCSVMASGQLHWEEKRGVHALKLKGVVNDRQVVANVAVIGDNIHLFNKVLIRM